MAEEFEIYKLKIYGPAIFSRGAPLDTTLPMQEAFLYIPKVRGLAARYNKDEGEALWNYITNINTELGTEFMQYALIGYSNSFGRYGSTLHGSFRSSIAKGWRYVDLPLSEVYMGYQITMDGSDYYIRMWLDPPSFIGQEPDVQVELFPNIGGSGRSIEAFPYYNSYSEYFRARFLVIDELAENKYSFYAIGSSGNILDLNVYLYACNEVGPTNYESLLMFFGNAIPINPDNPYPDPQPDPSPEVPTGENDYHSDPIPIPSLPNISAADTGFTRLFNPSLGQLNALAEYMWTDNNFWQMLVDKFYQMLEDPMKYIISLNLVPVQVPNGEAIPVKLLFINTGISMYPVTNQFVRVDCGTYTVKRNYGSALDFSPNTKVSVYLPYIGMVPLDVDEIMPSPPSNETVLGVTYTVDVFSGTCIAMVTVNGDVRYQFSGHCAIGIPFSAADFSTYQGALIQAAKTVLGAATTAAGMPGVGAALLGAPVQKTSETVETVTRFNPDTNRKLSPWEDKKSSVTKAQFGSLMANNVTNTVSQVAASKPNVERSAGFSGNTGYLAVRRPYLLFESPRLVNPDEYGAYNGYPSMMYLPFANLVGFTQVQQIQLKGFSGTNPEIDELLALLKSGVIF